MWIIFLILALIDVVKQCKIFTKEYLIHGFIKNICLSNVFSLLVKYIVLKDVYIIIFMPIIISDIILTLMISLKYKNNVSLIIYLIVMDILKLIIISLCMINLKY